MARAVVAQVRVRWGYRGMGGRRRAGGSLVVRPCPCPLRGPLALCPRQPGPPIPPLHHCFLIPPSLSPTHVHSPSRSLWTEYGARGESPQGQRA